MAQLTGAFLLLLTMNVLRFYEKTNVINKRCSFYKTFLVHRVTCLELSQLL